MSVTELQDISATTRRRFYQRAIYGMLATIATAFGVPALAYLFLPPKIRKSEVWVKACDISRVPIDQPVEIAFRRNRIDGWKIYNERNTTWLVKHSAQSVVAFGPQCTHLGCAYHFEEAGGAFVCPCHNSTFSLDGKVISGPAPRPLDRYETKLEGTILSIGALLTSSEMTAEHRRPQPDQA